MKYYCERNDETGRGCDFAFVSNAPCLSCNYRLVDNSTKPSRWKPCSLTVEYKQPAFIIFLNGSPRAVCTQSKFEASQVKSELRSKHIKGVKRKLQPLHLWTESKYNVAFKWSIKRTGHVVVRRTINTPGEQLSNTKIKFAKSKEN